MANNSLTNYQMYKLALKEPILATGLIGENPTFIVSTNNVMVVVVEGVGVTNSINIEARILGQSSFSIIKTITGTTSGTEVDVSTYDQVRFDCTTFDSGGVPTLIVSSFFKIGGGAASSAPKLIATLNTDISTLVGDMVVVNGTNSVTKISNNLFSTMPNGIFGVVYTKPTTTKADVLFVGIMGGYSGFTAGLPLFVSTAGIPTHTPPSTGMSQQIGFATSANEMFYLLMQPIRRS